MSLSLDSSSMHIDSRNKYLLVLSERATQSLDNATVTAETKYRINFTESAKLFVVSLHYNGSNIYWFVNLVKVYQFKAKDSEIKHYPLCLGNILKSFTIDNMKKPGLKGNVQRFLLIIILLILVILVNASNDTLCVSLSNQNARFNLLLLIYTYWIQSRITLLSICGYIR